MVEFSPLVVEFIDGCTWKLREDFLVTVDGRPHRVPAGFETNFATTPRVAWRVFPPTGRYGRAAVLHDWLYVVGDDRRAADSLFHKTMRESGVGAFTAFLFWAMVRLFGWKCWGGR